LKGDETLFITEYDVEYPNSYDLKHLVKRKRKRIRKREKEKGKF